MKTLSHRQWDWVAGIVDEIGIEFDRSEENMAALARRMGTLSTEGSRKMIKQLIFAGAIIVLRSSACCRGKPARCAVIAPAAQRAMNRLDAEEALRA